MFIMLVYLCDVTTFFVAEENLRNGITEKGYEHYSKEISKAISCWSRSFIKLFCCHFEDLHAASFAGETAAFSFQQVGHQG